jgi:glyoxylase-like metal-dependent hydrolase (beta-lactamase superfamily II)
MSLPVSLQFIQRDWLSCNQVLMCDSGSAGTSSSGYTLIDSGYFKHQEQTAVLVQHGMGAGRLTRLINTHLHSDHCGGNARLASQWACEVLVPQASLGDVQRWDTAALSYAGTGQHCPPFEATGGLAPNEFFEAGGMRWQALTAPGHDSKSYIYYAPQEGILISADALWGNGFGIIFPELQGESGFAEQEAVLNLIDALQPRLVLPGHGELFTDVKGALSRARSRLAALLDKPERNARIAIKALAKFSLLEQERLHLPSFIERQGKTSVNVACAQMLGQPIELLLRVAFDELAAIGAARLEQDYALNAEP